MEIPKGPFAGLLATVVTVMPSRRRIKLLKEILPQFGFEQERLRLTWIGASDGIQFAKIMQELVAQVKALGPNQARLKMVI